MGDPSTIPTLEFTHPDGRPRTRLEMDKWIRENISKTHWIRILATRLYGLQKQYTFGMQDILLRHWLLDEMIRRGQVTGELSGLNHMLHEDEAEVRQFTQRLGHLIRTNQAIHPEAEEGIDMNHFTPPPPPIIGNSQQTTQAPQAPAMPFAPQAPQPPQPPQMLIPQAPPMPQAQTPSIPTVTAAPMPTTPRTRRKATGESPPAAPVPGMPPSGFMPSSFPQNVPSEQPNTAVTVGTVIPSGGHVPLPIGGTSGFSLMHSQDSSAKESVQQPVDLAPLVDAIDKLSNRLVDMQRALDAQSNKVIELQRTQELQSITITALSRAAFNKPGSSNMIDFLVELGLITKQTQNPQ